MYLIFVVIPADMSEIFEPIHTLDQIKDVLEIRIAQQKERLEKDREDLKSLKEGDEGYRFHKVSYCTALLNVAVYQALLNDPSDLRLKHIKGIIRTEMDVLKSSEPVKPDEEKDIIDHATMNVNDALSAGNIAHALDRADSSREIYGIATRARTESVVRGIAIEPTNRKIPSSEEINSALRFNRNYYRGKSEEYLKKASSFEGINKNSDRKLDQASAAYYQLRAALCNRLIENGDLNIAEIAVEEMSKLEWAILASGDNVIRCLSGAIMDIKHDLQPDSISHTLDEIFNQNIRAAFKDDVE